MSCVRASVLYEFVARDPEELNIQPGEEISILGNNNGTEWYTARNRFGIEGLVPSQYVEIIDVPEPQIPPPPLPPAAYVDDVDSDEEDWDNENWSEEDAPPAPAQAISLRTPASGGLTVTGKSPENGSQHSREDTVSIRSSNYSENTKHSIVLKNISKSFGKNGGEDFLVGRGDSVRTEDKKISIAKKDCNAPCIRYIWVKPLDPYTCTISSTKKDSKLRGMKQFTSYQIVTSFSGIQISRRYKHFDWLHKLLQEKFICICIPPLPDRQTTGLFEQDFVEKRQRLLQEWLTRMTKHPVISNSDLLLNFLKVTDIKDWKSMKRGQEKDRFQGGKLFSTVHTTSFDLNWKDVPGRTDKLEHFYSELEKANKCFFESIKVFHSKQSMQIQREYRKVGDAFQSLSTALKCDPDDDGKPLAAAIGVVGDTFTEIGSMFEKQPALDCAPLMDRISEYSGILSVAPGVISLQRSIIDTVSECYRAQQSEKITAEDYETIKCRSGIVVQAVEAENSWLGEERDSDYRRMMQDFLQEQVRFYEAITNKLKASLDRFNGPV